MNQQLLQTITTDGTDGHHKVIHLRLDWIDWLKYQSINVKFWWLHLGHGFLVAHLDSKVVIILSFSSFGII